MPQAVSGPLLLVLADDEGLIALVSSLLGIPYELWLEIMFG